MSAADTTGHKLFTTTIHRHGRTGMAWKCECGNWHPKTSDAPFFGYSAPMDTVINYIKRVHNEHVAATTKD